MVKMPRTCPLSEGQWAIWSIHDMLGGACMTVGGVVSIPGGFAVGAFRRAVQRVVARHEALRTIYPTINGELVQVVLPNSYHEAPVITTAADADHEGVANDRLLALAQEVSDITTKPPWRMVVVRTPGGRTSVAWVINHISCDAWSFNLLVDQLIDAYHKERLESPRRTPSPETNKTQLKDQGLWEASPAGEIALQRGLDYWKARLADAPPYVHYTSQTVSAAGRGAALRCTFAISSELLDRVARVARIARATPFHFFTCALRLSILHLTGQGDAVIAMNYWNRTAKSLHTVGQFSKMLYLRDRLCPHDTFRTSLQQVRSTTREAYAHAAYSANALHDWAIRNAWDRGTPIPRWDRTTLHYNVPLPSSLQPPMSALQTSRGEVTRSDAVIDADSLRVWITAKLGHGASGEFRMSELAATPSALAGFVDHFLALIEEATVDDALCVDEIQSPRSAPQRSARAITTRGLIADLDATEVAVLAVPGVEKCTIQEISEASSSGTGALLATVTVRRNQFRSTDDLRALMFQRLRSQCAMPHRLDVALVDSDAEAPQKCADSRPRVDILARDPGRGLTATERTLLRVLGDPAAGIDTPAWDLGLRVQDVPGVHAKLRAEGLPTVPALAYFFSLPLTLYRMAEWIDHAAGRQLSTA
jgi:hypothetical protein